MEYYKFSISEAAIKVFNKLDNSIQIQIKEYFKRPELLKNPKVYGEKLRKHLREYWKYRIGNYRVIANIQDDKLVILMVSIGHRKEVYKKANRKFKK